MFKINNKTIVSISTLSVILAFGLIMAPRETKAATGSNVFYPGNDYDSNGYYYQPNYYQPYYQPPAPVYYVQPSAPAYVPAPAPTPIVYSNTVNPNAPKAVTKAKTKTAAPAVAAASKEEPADNYGSLAASAIFGSNSFLPSGLIQWILFAMLILGAVILVRRVYGGHEKYYATPMKHK